MHFFSNFPKKQTVSLFIYALIFGSMSPAHANKALFSAQNLDSTCPGYHDLNPPEQCESSWINQPKLSPYSLAMEIYAQHPTEARRLLKKEAKRNNFLAQFELAKMYRYGIGGKEDKASAMYWYRLSARQSYIQAQSELGHWLMLESTRMANQEGVNWLTKAAYQGDLDSQKTLGRVYMGSHHLRPDYLQAEKFLELASHQNDAEAQYMLATLYRTKIAPFSNQHLATYWLKESANQGYPNAMYSLAQAYELGNGVQKSQREAFHWYLKSAESDNALAQYQVGMRYMVANGTVNDSYKAFYWFERSAEQNIDMAQLELARMYEYGIATNHNPEKAYEWYLKAAKNHNADAQLRLGESFRRAIFTHTDQIIAHYWFCHAAEQQVAEGQFQCGSDYIIGQGVKKIDMSEALKWLEAAGHQEHVEAQAMLGTLYYEPWEASKLLEPDEGQNFKKAKYWLAKAANNGHGMSQWKLGMMYWNGDGVEQSFQQATRYIAMAANKGHAIAQAQFGLAYNQGLGVAKDYKQAAKWYRKAAYQNNGQAQYNLSSLYLKGRGLRKNILRAYSWSDLAAQNGQQDANRQRKQISHLLTQRQVESAQQLTQLLVREHNLVGFGKSTSQNYGKTYYPDNVIYGK